MSSNVIGVNTQPGVRAVALRSGNLDEFHVMAIPAEAGTDAACEARALYESIVRALEPEGPLRIVAEQLLCSLSDRDVILKTRAEVLKSSRIAADNPVSVVDGRPAERTAVSGALVTLVRESDAIGLTPAVDGERLCGYRIDDGETVRCWLTGIDGLVPGRPASSDVEQTDEMFRRAERVLAGVDLDYRKVICTRIRMKRMLEWYDRFNAVRNAYYTKLGLFPENAPSLVPPSTGIQGKISDDAEIVMEVVAMTRGEAGCPFTRLVNPLQNEATDYGSAFARAGAMDMPGVRYVFISGTASIDTTGASVYTDDPRKQVVKTLENFQTIAQVGGAGIGDLVQAIWYCKDASYAAVIREEAKRRGWPDLPFLMTVGDVCRHDLFVEMEGLAVVPSP